jgi:hypothetical protein
MKQNGFRERIGLLRESAIVTTAGAFFLVAIILGSLNFILEIKEFAEPNSHPTWWKALELKLTGEGSLAFLSIGAIALLLELPHLSKYFQTKVANTIRGKEYLKTLKPLELEALQADALKALWELEDIGGEDSLYNFAKTKVTGCVAQPYRQNILGRFSIKSTPDRNAYEVEETISYTCRSIRDCIQDELKWATEPDEILRLDNFRITLEIPNELFKDAVFLEANPVLRNQVEDFDKDEKSEKRNSDSVIKTIISAIWPSSSKRQKEKKKPAELVEYGKGEGYTLSLKAYQHVDKLDVRLYLRYVAPVGRSFTWQMTHPSKNITGVIVFPPELSFYLETFGVSSDELRWDRKSSTDSPQVFKYNSWLLPDSGFVFHFIPRP